MKNQILTIKTYTSLRKIFKALPFWLAVLCALGLIVLAATVLLAPLTHAGRRGESAAPRLTWLLTSSGERRGFVLQSDVRRDAEAWELWGNGGGKPALEPLAELCPDPVRAVGLGFNGGFWDEFEQPVGVCAGQRGIHAARSHAGGFALGQERAWIGPLTVHVRLKKESRPSTAPLEVALNPRPLSRRGVSLIDPLAYPGPFKLDFPAQVAWLDRGNRLPLKFNSTVPLKVTYAHSQPVAGEIRLPPPGGLLLVRPLRGGPPSELRVGDLYSLELSLDQLKGVVQLATSAGPRLVRAGQLVEGLGRNQPGGGERTWRTAVGTSRDGRRLWVVMLARGKDGLSGVTLRETAQTLLEQGAYDAINLDGGTSTSAWSTTLRSELRALFPLQFQINHGLFLRKAVEVSSAEE